MKFTKTGFYIAVLFCVFTFNLHVHALPGDLDTTFDTDGKTTASIGVNDYARDVAIQPDGKIVLVGYTAVDFSLNNLDVSLTRFNADGSLDTSFGTGGTVILVEAGNQRADAVLLLPGGKILAIGSDANRLTVFRFNSDGSADMTFGTNGRVTQFIGDRSNGNDAVLQPDGKIVIAGMLKITGETLTRFTVFRLNADGSFDTSFNTIGYTTLADATEAFAVALQADGKIIAGGATGNLTKGRWGRLGADGILEGASVFSDAELRDVVIQPDGKYVFAGLSVPPGGGLRRFTIARFNTDKTRDVHFGNGGFNWVDWSSLGGSITEAYSLFIQPSGRIIVGGLVLSTDHESFGLARFGAHGFLDQGFGNGGKVLTLPGTGGSAGGELGAIAQQADGKIVAVGNGFNGASFDYAAARYDAGDSNTAQNRAQYDFDGDGRSDVSVYRPSTGAWYIFNSRDSSVTVRTFGITNDVPVPADFDGDAKTDFAIYRPSNAQWWYLFSGGNGSPQQFTYTVGGVPRPGDFSGDGRADIIAYEPVTWNRRDSANTSPSNVVFGAAGDKPVLGDFDGDAKVDPAIYRPSTGEWWYAASASGGAHRAARWGISTDIPAPADYDGDFRTDFAVYRPSEGVWYIYNSATNSPTILNFGLSEDKPVAADYDGDGKADIAVFRPSTGVWYLMQSTAGFSAMQFGVSTDIPTPNAFVP
jgi:uncharacterized delta-60 repeat protein